MKFFIPYGLVEHHTKKNCYFALLFKYYGQRIFKACAFLAYHHKLFELTSVQLDDNLLFISSIRQTYLTVVVMFQCIRTTWVWIARRFRSSCLWCWQTPTTSVCRNTAPSCGAKPWVSHHITFLIYLTLLVLVDVKIFTFYLSQSFYFVV